MVDSCKHFYICSTPKNGIVHANCLLCDDEQDWPQKDWGEDQTPITFLQLGILHDEKERRELEYAANAG